MQSYTRDPSEIQVNEDGTFQCSFCDHKSKYKYNLKLHMNKHTGKYRCDVCNVNLSTLQYLEKHNESYDHLTRSHQSSLMQPESYSNGYDYKSYEEPTPPSDQVRYSQTTGFNNENVSDSGRNFSMDYLLDSSTHSEEYDQNITLDPEPPFDPYVPRNDYINQQIPSRNVKNASSFITDQKGFPCEQCGNSYPKLESLKRHMISHSERFKCQTCETGFTEQGRLTRHLQNKDNCNKYLVRRAKTSEGQKEHNWSPYPASTESAMNGIEPLEFPPGIQVTKTQAASMYNSFANSNLADKFLSNPNLSVQIKSEPIKPY